MDSWKRSHSRWLKGGMAGWSEKDCHYYHLASTTYCFGSVGYFRMGQVEARKSREREEWRRRRKKNTWHGDSWIEQPVGHQDCFLRSPPPTSAARELAIEDLTIPKSSLFFVSAGLRKISSITLSLASFDRPFWVRGGGELNNRRRRRRRVDYSRLPRPLHISTAALGLSHKRTCSSFFLLSLLLARFS